MNWKIREVSLAELPELMLRLRDSAVTAGFQPDCVVYLETGARLLAAEACRQLGVGAIPLKIQRRGATAKGNLAHMLGSLPTWAKDILRQLEARLLWKRMKHDRLLRDAPAANLSNCRVLLLDDAVDAGTSVRLAREWVVRCGARLEDVRVAAITVTTDLADDLVDFVLFRQMCRFPWSSDSRELDAYSAMYARTVVPPFIRDGIAQHK